MSIINMNRSSAIVALVIVVAAAVAPIITGIECLEVRNLGLFDELEKYWLRIAKFSTEVEEISQFLEQNVEDPNDRQTSILALEQMAAQQVHNRRLHQAIMKLISLKQVLGSTRLGPNCDGREYVMLAEGYLLIGGEPRNFTQLSRAEQLVLGFGYEHKKLCLPKYVWRFEKAIRSARQRGQKGQIDRLRRLFSHEFVHRLAGDGVSDGLDSAAILEVKLTKFRVYDSALLRELARNIEKEGFDTPVSLRQKAHHIVDELRQPCEQYCESLGDVFRPTKFDVMTFAGKPTLLCNDRESEFCNHWKLFRVCEAYIKAKKSKLVAKLELIIERDRRS